LNFSSNIENAKKSLAKVMNHRLEKLSTLLDTEFKMENITEISIEMQSYLISKELDNLLFFYVLNEDFREQSKLISILISSIIQQSPLLNIYKEKKKLLLDTLNYQRVNEKNLFREKLVSAYFFHIIFRFL
jgi:hypothetical protein